MHSSILGSQEKQAEILDQILSIGQAAQRHIAERPKKVYQLLVEVVCNMTGADCAVIYPYHPAFGEFYDVENVAACGLLHDLPVEEKADKKRRLSARVHREGEVVREDIEREEPQMLKESSFIAREGIQAFMGLSLRVGDNILGILYVDYRQPHSFSEDEKRIIHLIGQQAAMAISNSWSYRLADMRAEAVARLKAVGQSLVAIEDPTQTLDSVLEDIAHSAQEVLDADIVDLYQYIQARNEFALPPTLMGERLHLHLIPTKIYDDDVVVAAVKMGESQYFHDARAASLLTRDFDIPHDDAPDERFVVREKVASSAIIPLRVVGETVGVMFVNYRTPQFFGPEQKDVIESFAAQAAVAIRNARLFQLEQEQRQQSQALLNDFQILHDVANNLAKQPVLEQIYQVAVQSAVRTLNCSHSTIFILDKRVGELVAMERIGSLHGVSEVGRFKPGEGLAGTVAKTGESILVNDAASDDRFTAGKVVPRSALRSIILAPIKIENEIVGVISADKDEVGGFTQHNLEMLETLALDLGIAINLRRQQDTLQAVAEFQRAISSVLPVQAQLGQVYEKMSGLMDTSSMFIALYEDDTGVIRFPLVYERGQLIDDEVKVEGRPYAPRPFGTRRGLTEWVIRHREPLLVEDFEAWAVGEDEVEKAFRQDVKCCLLVPALFKDRIIGAIGLQNFDQPCVFDNDDRNLLITIANQMAIAIENARLYQDLERRVYALSALNEVGQTLTSGIRLKEDEILKLIYGQARRLTGTQNIYIALYDEKTDTITFRLVMERGRRVDVEQQKGFAPRKIDKAKRGKTEEVILTRKPILHKTHAEALAWYNEPGHREYVGEVSASHLAVPMVVAERVIGVLAIYDWEREHAYDEQDLQVLSSMASQAAIALDNANLYAATREELIAARQLAALGTVTAAIQHRINNTLNIIVPNVTRLRKRVDTSNETIQEILDIIERNTQYTSDYIARIQEPLKETEVQAVDINASLREAQAQIWGQYQDRAGFGAVKVAYNLDDSLPLIQASLGQITEIFRNLIENSYKAMSPDGGNLTIVSRRVDDRLEVEIQDTGPGIPANIRDKLFIKPVPSRRPGEGSGLGLWLTGLLLQKYAGEISIEKTGADGTMMLVRLPVSRS